MSSDEDEGADWRSMRRRVPPTSSGQPPEKKTSVKQKSRTEDDGVVAALPGGLKFVRPSSQSIKPRLADTSIHQPPPNPPSEDSINPKDRKIRRGEVGKDMQEVVKLESSGFVMTGSRNSRLTMLRELKEAETVTEDQRREELMEMMKNRAEKEDELIANFRALLMAKKSSH